MNDIRQTRPNANARARTDDVGSRPAGTPARPVGDSEVGGAGGALHASASEIVALTARLRELPATRVEVIQVAKERLGSGQYLTRESAIHAAAAILAR